MKLSHLCSKMKSMPHGDRSSPPPPFPLQFPAHTVLRLLALLKFSEMQRSAFRFKFSENMITCTLCFGTAKYWISMFFSCCCCFFVRPKEEKWLIQSKVTLSDYLLWCALKHSTACSCSRYVFFAVPGSNLWTPVSYSQFLHGQNRKPIQLKVTVPSYLLRCALKHDNVYVVAEYVFFVVPRLIPLRTKLIPVSSQCFRE